MCVCVCVHMSVCVCVLVWVYECVCVCVFTVNVIQVLSLSKNPPTHTHTANDATASICNMADGTTRLQPQCDLLTCDCPFSQYDCPEDSIIIETRIDGCCLRFDCVCPSISCPFLMEGGLGVQPVARYRGNQFPGRCCPSDDYVGMFESILQNISIFRSIVPVSYILLPW